MLTTKQFIKEMESLGFKTEIQKAQERITVYKRGFPFSMVFFHVNMYGTSVEFIGGIIDSKNVGLLNLLLQYFETPDEDRMEEDYYYIFWSDVCGGEFFLDREIISCPDYYSFEKHRTFNGVNELEEDNGNHYLKPYQFTEDEIKSLPTKWRPAYFGGLGFTDYVKVEDEKVAR